MISSIRSDAELGPRLALCMFLACALSACGGGGGGGGDAPAASSQAPTYTLGGAITGLSSTGLALQNGQDSLTAVAAATSFTFGTGLPGGAAYAVTVGTQPATQTCTVSNGSGSVAAANVTNVQVTCVSSSTVSLGGKITGLKADGLSISNGTETLTLSRIRVGFTFTGLVPVGSNFAVTVTSQPTGQTCTITPAAGTIPARAVDILTVACVDALALGAEFLPDLNAPQPGSAAERKVPLVGIYTKMFSTGFMLVSPALQTMHQDVVALVSGSMAVTDNTWTYQPGTTSNFLSPRPVGGSGTFVLGKSLEGTYRDLLDTTRTPANMSLDYDAANALAVTQDSLQGLWQYLRADDQITLNIDAEGSVTGTSTGATFGACVLSGAVKLADPASNVNVFQQTLLVSGTACKLVSGVPYAGLSAILFAPAGAFVGNGYYRQLTFSGVTEAGATVTLPVTRQH